MIIEIWEIISLRYEQALLHYALLNSIITYKKRKENKFNKVFGGVNDATAIQHMIYLLFTTMYQCYTKCTISCFYLNHLSHNLQKSLIRSSFKFSSINGLHLELVLNVFIVIFFFSFFFMRFRTFSDETINGREKLQMW